MVSQKVSQKICVICNQSFVDNATYKRRVTCSVECKSIAMKNKRYSVGSYKRSKVAIEKDLATKRSSREKQFSDVSYEELISLYEDVLSEKISRFPLGLFQFGDYQQKGIWLVKYLIEQKLKLQTDEEIKQFFTLKNFQKYKLSGQVLVKCFNKHIWNVVELCYPGRFRWAIKNQNNLWNQRKAKPTTLVPKLNSKEQLISFMQDHVSSRLTKDSSLDVKNFFTTEELSKLEIYNNVYRYYSSLWDFLNDCYPNKFQQWEVRNQNNIWSKDSSKNYTLAREATRWLIEEKLKIDLVDIIGKVNYKTFKIHGLESMLACTYKHSYIEALLDCYPNLNRAMFPQTQKLAILGYEFEGLCKRMIEERGLSILNKSFKSKSINCPDLLFSESHWGDLKLSTSGYFNSGTDKYLDYCDKLTIVYLIKNSPIKETSKLKFITIDKMFSLHDNEIEQLGSLKRRYYELLKE
jgi:hypothetical protein